MPELSELDKINSLGNMKKMVSKPSYYTMVPSVFGTIGIIWQEIKENPKVHRVFLPNEETPMENVVMKTFPEARPLSCPEISELSQRMQSFLEGEALGFELNIIALEECSEFQKKGASG